MSEKIQEGRRFVKNKTGTFIAQISRAASINIRVWIPSPSSDLLAWHVHLLPTPP
jgi:hypothetical protein